MKQKSQYGHWHVNGILLPNPKPVYREGMPERLVLTAVNGGDLFVVVDGAYRPATEAERSEYTLFLDTGHEPVACPLSPFPRLRNCRKM